MLKIAKNNSEFVDSLFEKGGTCSILINKVNKRSVYFTYNNKKYVLTGLGVIAKFSDVQGKRYYQHAVLDFETSKYEEIKKAICSLFLKRTHMRKDLETEHYFK